MVTVTRVLLLRQEKCFHGNGREPLWSFKVSQSHKGWTVQWFFCWKSCFICCHQRRECSARLFLVYSRIDARSGHCHNDAIVSVIALLDDPSTCNCQWMNQTYSLPCPVYWCLTDIACLANVAYYYAGFYQAVDLVAVLSPIHENFQGFPWLFSKRKH